MGGANVRLVILGLLTAGLLIAATVGVLMQPRPTPRIAPGSPPLLKPVPVVPPRGPSEPGADPQTSDTEPTEPGGALAQAGLRALEAGDPGAAVRLLERALEASPQNVRWRDLLTRARAELAAREDSDAPARPEPPATGNSSTATPSLWSA